MDRLACYPMWITRYPHEFLRWAMPVSRRMPVALILKQVSRMRRASVLLFGCTIQAQVVNLLKRVQAKWLSFGVFNRTRFSVVKHIPRSRFGDVLRQCSRVSQ